MPAWAYAPPGGPWEAPLPCLIPSSTLTIEAAVPLLPRGFQGLPGDPLSSQLRFCGPVGVQRALQGLRRGEKEAGPGQVLSGI